MSDISARVSLDGCMSTMHGGNKMFTPMPGGRTRKAVKAKSFRQSHQTTLGSSPVLCKGQRKTLHVIQPAVCNKTKLKETTNIKPKSSKRKHNSDTIEKASKISKCEWNGLQFPIYEDPKTILQDGTDIIEKPKTAEEEAWELMVQEPAPESYWRDLAEERRIALEETLKENEKLHGTIVELRIENGRLKEMADQAEYLASLLQNVIEGKEVNADSEASGSNEDPESCKQVDKHTEEETEEDPNERCESSSENTSRSSCELSEGNVEEN